MAIDPIIAGEIFTNPNDLFFSVFQPKGKGGIWKIVIRRGEGCNYKLLFPNGADQFPPILYSTREEAIEGLMNLLTTVIEHCEKDLEDPDSTIKKTLDRRRGNVLTAQDVAKIKERLNKPPDTIDTSEERLSPSKHSEM
jgi:hypothetical protein